MRLSAVFLFFVTCLLTLPITVSHAGDEEVMIVLDASGSMWGRIDGKPKIEIAREVMGQVLSDLDGKAEIGVITYGHRRKGDCGDIETILPVGKVDHERYMGAISRLSPKGKTPITAAVRQGAEELKFTEEKATVVLISDGLETCKADPCGLARELESKGVDFTVHVVGFDLKDEDTTSLQCLAAETGGKYLAADNARELGEAIGSVVAKAPPSVLTPKPEPAKKSTTLKLDVLLAAGGEPVKNAYAYIIPETADRDRSKAAASGVPRRPYKLEPGRYFVEASLGKAKGSVLVDVEADKANHAEIVLGAGYLSVKAVAKQGGNPIAQAYIYVDELQARLDGKRKNVTAGNQRNLFTVPAGKYFVTATHGKARVGQEVEISAGQRHDVVIVLASGILKVDVLAEEGGKAQLDAYVTIFENLLQADGKRKRIASGNQRQDFSLPAGEYFVVASVGKAKVGGPVIIAAGKRNEVTMVVGVGTLKVSGVPVEGAKPLNGVYINVHELEKDLKGKRKRIAGGGQRTLFKLPAGKYLAVAKIGNAQMAAEVDVRAGKMTETTIILNAGALAIKAEKGVYITVYDADKNLDGSRDRVTGHGARKKPVMLPAGRYLVTGKKGQKIAEAQVEVKAGKLSEISLKP